MFAIKSKGHLLNVQDKYPGNPVKNFAVDAGNCSFPTEKLIATKNTRSHKKSGTPLFVGFRVLRGLQNSYLPQILR
jgi:hypothetical protein